MASSEFLDFNNIKTYSINSRNSLVDINYFPERSFKDFDTAKYKYMPDFLSSLKKVVSSHNQFILFYGAHLIKNGLSKYIIDLMKLGVITHLAGNGACSIHDFEIAYSGRTSEDVSESIKDGSFGMCEETGFLMNQALIDGAKHGRGYGQSIAYFIDHNLDKFPYSNLCILYQAYKLGIPVSFHIAIGTDIIHQHPSVDFASIGITSGIDFKLFCNSISKLNKGLYINLGSSVIGPEVFLKSLSICRNLGYPTNKITTVNIDLNGPHEYCSKDNFESEYYYYRPLKNIVRRPNELGGIGWHFNADMKLLIPYLYHYIKN